MVQETHRGRGGVEIQEIKHRGEHGRDEGGDVDSKARDDLRARPHHRYRDGVGCYTNSKRKNLSDALIPQVVTAIFLEGTPDALQYGEGSNHEEQVKKAACKVR